MATGTSAEKTICVKCNKVKRLVTCKGCSKEFCYEHLGEHHQELNELFGQIEDEYNQFKVQCDQFVAQPSQHHLLKEVDQWEEKSLEKVRLFAQNIRQRLSTNIVDLNHHLNAQLKHITEQIRKSRSEDDFIDQEIDHFRRELQQLKDLLNKPPNVKIDYISRSFIEEICLISNEPLIYAAPIDSNAKWTSRGLTVAGGCGRGSGLDHFNNPWGLCVDANQTLYIADHSNHRVVEWKCAAKTGRVIAGGKGDGNRDDQLSQPTNVIIDQINDDLIICDSNNKRIVRWSRHQEDAKVETIISNIACSGIAMDQDGSLYIVDQNQNAVKRYRRGQTEEIIVAGGNGQGDGLHQLSRPTYVFVDRDYSIYISDSNNHRIMKWTKDAREGIVVAGGQGQGNSLAQLSSPHGLMVDGESNIYVVDHGNHRLIRLKEGNKLATLIVGGNGQGNRSNQLSQPSGLALDRQGNLYLTDQSNQRVQKFELDTN